MRTLYSDFSVLGIPPQRWPEVLADSRTLSFEQWVALHVNRPATVDEHTWEFMARRVYEDGPLAYYLSTHVN